jgi:hypothetical protein
MEEAKEANHESMSPRCLVVARSGMYGRQRPELLLVSEIWREESAQFVCAWLRECVKARTSCRRRRGDEVTYWTSDCRK